MQFGLKEKDIAAINSVFAKYQQIQRVLLYGSRAKGNFKNGSDIDLAIEAQKLSLSDLLKIENLLDDLLLPYTFDLSDISTISNADLLEHIKRVGKVFYDPTENAALLNEGEEPYITK